jgi:DNA-directed RNA polymerase specialized sigma24 family protein
VSELPTGVRPDTGRVYRTEHLALVRLAVLLTGSREVAEDAVQTAFAASIERWESLDDPVAYLRRVVINQTKDHHFRRGRRLVPGSEPVTGEPVVDEAWAEVLRLPARQRAVVVLRFYEDPPLTEIAALLDRPAGTVRSDLHRALDRRQRGRRLPDLG